ncbi:cilia- and flagella-associated protein 52 [Anoplophora glabripennis]|uniref:cilia- and flagella-associated protein 52 n=1 Tax=Anoplophora glabripennis TaxID=217634 RepID=UPI0008742E3F|nr:cilia- and flagella-associated protein 52 [Anoplophora glabripennis]
MCDDAELEEGHVEVLNVKGIIGFDGSTLNGLLVHPNGKHVVYPLGNKVVIQNWTTKEQNFLTGHTNIISSVAASVSGKYLASGQINHIGFKARVIIWDFEKQELLAQHEHHKVRVEAVAFSKDEHYVISLGGRDCGTAVVWDMHKGQVLCGSQVSRGVQGDPTCIQTMTRRGACFLTAGDNHLALWKINQEARNLKSFDVSMPKLKRNVVCLDINERDEFCYCGTTTGDVLKVRLYYHHDAEMLDPVKQPAVVGCLARITKKKLPRGCVDLYRGGIRSIRLLFNGNLIIGAGDGTLEVVEEAAVRPPIETNIKMPSVPALRVLKSTNVNSSITSIQLMEQETKILAATTNSEIYVIRMDDFRGELVVTCHTSAIYDVAFPQNFSEVFATAGKHDVRVWSMSTMQELLRIRVPNFSCSSVVFSHNGKSILTAWNDGVIRSFTPLTGRLIYAIYSAHNKGVSALTTTSHGRNLVSGGCEGQVRLWEVSPYRQQLICTLKEHKGPVSAIDINKFDNEAASASTDGTCIIWDLEKQCRRQILFANTLFMCVRYYPSGVQILTGGSDRKVVYWEVLDGNLVRELEGSPSATVNTLDICPDGEKFVSGGNDQLVKLWRYQEGITTHIGIGHAAVITCTRFSANGKFIVTCDASGGVFVWECPQEPAKEVKETERAAEVPPPKSNPNKEEDVHDLPSYRSNKSGGDAKSGKADDWCKCSVRSSRTSCSERGGGDDAKGSSKCSSQGSVKSKTSVACKEEPKGQTKANGDDQKSTKSKSLSSCDQESVKSKSEVGEAKTNTLASTKTLKSLRMSKGSGN